MSNKITHIVTGLVLLSLTVSCSDELMTDDVPPSWSLPTPLPIVEGRYKILFEVKQDNCTPSLASIKEQNSRWPGEYISVIHPRSVSGERERSRLETGYVHPRFGLGFVNDANYQRLSESILGTKMLDFESVYDVDYKSFKHPSYKIHNKCFKDKPLNNLKEKITFNYISEVEFEVEVRDIWNISQACEAPSPFDQFDIKTVPQFSCSEIYVLRYKIDDEFLCSSDCYVASFGQATTISIENLGEQYYPILGADDVKCLCGADNPYNQTEGNNN